MKKLKRFFLIIVCIFLLPYMFRNLIYNGLFSYKSIGKCARSELVLSESMKVPSDDELLKITHTFVNQTLKLSDASASQEPNAVNETGKANCIGYAALFTSYFNITAKANQLNFKAEHHKGQIYLFGNNIHKYISNPFFKDHDFVIITNLETKEKFAVDPTISDYLAIKKVSLR